jgi:acyl-CoA thioester hydrolase
VNHQVRVIFGDTDQMGVVYYANYLRYFEAARAALLRAVGKSQRDLERLEIGFPVTEAHCRYRRPARYEDLLDVEVRVTAMRAASLVFEYEIRREGELLVDGHTVHACVAPSGRPVRIPAELRALLAPEPAAFSG